MSRLSQSFVSAVAFCISVMAVPVWSQSPAQQVTVYDGSEPKGAQLDTIWQSPQPVQSPRYQGGTIFVPKARNGHFYLHGFINGFPVVFMVDTGSSAVALPEEFAYNAGIRAGLGREVQTASGVVRANLSRGNTVGVGPIGVQDVEVVLVKNLKIPLLGANVLQKFRVTSDDRGMTLVWLKP